MDLFLLLTVMVQRFIFYAMLVFPVIVIVYLIARRPFKLMGNNVRLVII